MHSSCGRLRVGGQAASHESTENQDTVTVATSWVSMEPVRTKYTSIQLGLYIHDGIVFGGCTTAIHDVRVILRNSIRYAQNGTAYSMTTVLQTNSALTCTGCTGCEQYTMVESGVVQYIQQEETSK